MSLRKIIKIARLELSILIYSPVVWLVLPIFLVLCGMSFLDMLQQTRTGLSMSGGDSGGSLTFELYSGPVGLFPSIQQTLYLYLPILTMGLMSRETSSGSIKLLLSSPVKLREIIWGKYLAMVVLSLLFIAILALYAVIGAWSIKQVDAGLLCSALFGIFLLLATYAAIGLFMSCLTSYQIVAAIATLAVFAALRFVGEVGQSIDFVRDLTYFLSISGRTETMIRGLISTKDVFYYIIIIGLFLSLCTLYLRNKRELKSRKVKVARYCVLVVIVLAAGYLTSRPVVTGYLDMTAGKVMSVTTHGQEIAKKIDGKLEVTTYVNLLSPNMGFLMPERRNIDLSRLEMYKRFIPGMETSYVYYYHDLTDSTLSMSSWHPNFKGVKSANEIAEKVCLMSGYDLKDFMKPAAIDKIADLKPEGYIQVRKLEYKGKSTFLRFFVMGVDQYPFESEWMAALQRLTGNAPHIVFLSGNNEVSITSKNDAAYRKLLTSQQRREAMVNQGFDVDSVNLDLQDIPAKTDILILADPTVAFNTAAMQKLTDYISKGGNMLITTNPGRQAIVNPLLQQLGIQVKPGMLVKPDKDLNKDNIAAVYPAQAESVDRNISMLRAAKRPVLMQGAAALSYTTSGPFHIQPLLVSPQGGWNKATPIDVNAPTLTYDTAKGDEKGEYPVVAMLTRNIQNKEQRIIVSGDADYVSNSEFNKPIMEEMERQLSADLLFRWLTVGQYPVGEIRPQAKDTNLKVSREQISMISIVCKFVLPAILVIMGSILLFKRRSN